MLRYRLLLICKFAQGRISKSSVAVITYGCKHSLSSMVFIEMLANCCSLGGQSCASSSC
jgi:hypothetical protein